LDWRLRIHVISLRELVLLQRSLCSIDDVGAFKARGFPDAWLSTVQPALPLLPAKRKNGGPKPTPLTQNRLRRRGSVFRRTKNGPPSPISRGKWSERIFRHHCVTNGRRMVNLAQMAGPFAHFGNRGCAVYAASFARIWEQQGKNGLRSLVSRRKNPLRFLSGIYQFIQTNAATCQL
jgi:hypothetical protein